MNVRAWVSEAEQRYSRVRGRLEDTHAGRVQRRITELEVTKKALILAALSLILFIPALISLAAILPLGNDHGLAHSMVRHLRLTPEATRDVQKLFGNRQALRGSTTVLGTVVTVVFAYGWPAELRRGYEIIWHQSPRGLREAWRPLVWLGSFFGIVAVVAGTGSISSGSTGTLISAVILMPILFGWSLWSLHLLLSARVPYPALVPSAITTAIGLVGLGVVTSLYMSRNIVSNSNKYGPIGVVFTLLSWMIGFSTVMLGGPLIGQLIHESRTTRRDDS
jgi:membrane protein